MGPPLRRQRTADGTFNDLHNPDDGQRRHPLRPQRPDRPHLPDRAGHAEPNPRTVSRELLTRHEFVPATTLNVLAAAWLQFMIRDWFSHGKSPKENPWSSPLDPTTTPGPSTRCGSCARRPDPTRPPDEDAAAPHLRQHRDPLVGRLAALRQHSRDPGEGPLGEDGKLGSARRAGPGRSDYREAPRRRARLLGRPGDAAHALRLRAQRDLRPPARRVPALDRRRAVRPRPARQHRAAGEDPHGRVDAGHPRPPDPADRRCAPTGGASPASGSTGCSGASATSEVISGIVGGRDRPLRRALLPDRGVRRRLPDAPAHARRLRLPLRRATTRCCEERQFHEIAGRARARAARADRDGRPASTRSASPTPARSCCTTSRATCRSTSGPTAYLMDLAATDILRSASWACPATTTFRRLLHMQPVRELRGADRQPEWREELRRVYDDDIELRRPEVGHVRRGPPEGFGFSDTAFRIFVLMASRRLNSDRFFTADYTPEVYTAGGLDGSTTTHGDRAAAPLPAARAGARQVKNAFAPWTRVA